MTVMQSIAAAAAISIMTVNAAQQNTHLLTCLYRSGGAAW